MGKESAEVYADQILARIGLQDWERTRCRVHIVALALMAWAKAWATTIRKNVALVLMALSLAACASAPSNPAQAQWIAARDRQPLEFVVTAEESESAWSRANEWIARFAALPIQSATEYSIQTAAGSQEFDARPELTVTRRKNQDGSWVFNVRGRVQNPLSAGDMERQCHALAYYTASGIPYPGS
jgi:hypothetical protein